MKMGVASVIVVVVVVVVVVLVVVAVLVVLVAGSCIFGINPCDVACANVNTGVAVVVSRHKENLPGCALI